MRKTYLESLPRNSRNHILWKETIGAIIPFTYNGVEGNLEVVGYEVDDKNRTLLTIKYNNKTHKINSSSVLKGAIGNIIDKSEQIECYKYKVGDIVENNKCRLKILSTIMMSKSNGTKTKGYRYVCLTSGREHEIMECKISAGQGCGVCTSKQLLVGVNDIATVAPQMVSLLTNKNDAKKYHCQSGKKISFTCPHCKYERVLTISNVYKQGFVCPVCSPTTPYPERFVSVLLKQLLVEYKTQQQFDWSQGKQYDFYIPSLNMIIETHGKQHYEECSLYHNKYRTLEQEIANDTFKEELAKKNGIDKYVVLDCRYSDKKWIMTSVLSSELSNIFRLDDIDWDSIHWQVLKNSDKAKAYQMWNNGASVQDIAKILKVSNVTVNKYLISANDMGLCSYNPNEERQKCGKRLRDFIVVGIIAINTKTQEQYHFESISECIETLRKKENTPFVQKLVRQVCWGERESYKGYIFKECK